MLQVTAMVAPEVGGTTVKKLGACSMARGPRTAVTGGERTFDAARTYVWFGPAMSVWFPFGRIERTLTKRLSEPVIAWQAAKADG